jgi:hypothetical protein
MERRGYGQEVTTGRSAAFLLLLLAGACGSHGPAEAEKDAAPPAPSIECLQDDNGCVCGAKGTPEYYIKDGTDVSTCSPSSIMAAAGSSGALCCTTEGGSQQWPPAGQYSTATCSCTPYYCATTVVDGDMLCYCSFGSLTPGDTAVPQCLAPSGGHYCRGTDATKLCFAEAEPCESDDIEVSSCDAATLGAEADACGGDGYATIATCGDATAEGGGGGSGSDAGSGSEGWADTSTCQTGAGNTYICCGLAGGGCESVDNYAACCENKGCAAGQLIACLAGHEVATVDDCNAAIAACN